MVPGVFAEIANRRPATDRVICPHCWQEVPASLQREGKSLDLRKLHPSERFVFLELAKRPGLVVPTDTLERHTHSLKVVVTHLRQKLGVTIRCVWGRGYYLEAGQ